MRQGSFTLDNLMRYIYGEQISKIPAKLYNDDAQVKYLDFGSLYTYCCHGSKEHQIRRWLRERIAYVDSMLGYFTSQEDQVTIRMNKTGKVSFEVTPYIPLYFSVKWSNATGGTQTFKLKRGETKTFNYSSTTSTDQEVIIYHAKYIKRLDNLSNLNPSSCILSNAVKLTNVEIHSSELYNINVTNNKFLRSINLENCTALGTVTATGSSLNLSNCKYLRYCNVYNTNLTEVQLNTSGGSLTEIYYPKSIQSINLVKQRLLELVGLPYGYNNIIPLDGKVEGKVFEVKGANSLDINTLEIDSSYLADSSEFSCWTKATDISNLGTNEFDIIKSNRSDGIRIYAMNSEGKNLSVINSIAHSTTLSFTVPEGTKYLLYSHIKGDVAIVSKGDKEFNLCTSLYTISIQECPSIKRLNTSRDISIASSFASMVYVNNLTIRNSLDLASLNFDGFHRLQNVIIENMYNLEEVGFNNLLPIGETSTIKYIGMSNCPKLGTIELNCTSNDYEITFADDAILNFGGLFKLNSITSNCVLKGIKTIVVPINLESMFFTNEYGSGYSTIENIWVSSQCNVDTQATTPIVTHVDSTYSGIDFLGMNLKNIDLGALVNIPKAINFKLSPTTVNPHFNLNRDGETYKYLQPVGTLDLSNYTESLAKFFDGVDLDKLEIICNNNLPQTDLSYCFYNSSFSTNEAINKLLTKVSSITNLDYCFYKTTIDSVDILDEINMGASSSMNYTFAECPNIKTLNNVVIPSKVTSVAGMFNKCPLTTITNMIVNVRGSISGLFKGCNKLTTINTLRIPNVTDVSNTFDGCTSLSSLSGFELPSSCTNVSNLFNGCYMLTELCMDFSSNITAGDNWYPPNLETLHDTTISNDYVKLTGCSTLKTINNLTLRISVTPTSFFNGCTALETINYIDIGGTLTSVKALFKDMNLTSLNNVTFSSSSIIDYTECFRGVNCINSSTIINFPTFTDNNISMSSTFNSCTGLTSIVSLDYSKVYNMTAMYWNAGITSINDVQFGANICDLAFGRCINLSSINNVSFPNATSMRQIFYGTAITDTSLTVPDSCTDISEMFSGCTNLTDISGLTIGSGVTSTTDWIAGSPITTANNITMKNNNTKFTGTATLVSCTNFKITSDVTELNNIFQNCSKLASFSFSDESNFSNLTGLEYAFDANSSLVTLDLSNVVCTSKLTTINGLCRTCSALTTLYLPSNLQDSSITSIIQIASSNRSLRTLYNLYLPDGFKWFGNYAFGWVGTVEPYHAMDVIGFRVPNTTNPAEVFAGVCKMFKTFRNVTWSETTTSIAGMFKDMIHLTHDLEIPAHITNCENAFKGCTSMTHVHSNWNNSYDNGITSTDCYAGCTAVTHIDGEKVTAYEGDLGVDYIPTAWGGNGFDEIIDYCGVYELQIPNDNYQLILYGSLSSGCVNTPPGVFSRVNWGDGTVEQVTNGSTHTYAKAGTYYLKGNVANGKDGQPFNKIITKVLRHPKIINNQYCHFWANCSKLIYADVSNFNPSLMPTTALDYFFKGCTSLTSVDLSNWDVSNVTSMNFMFQDCTNLQTITGLEKWNTSKVTDFREVFFGCTSLSSFPAIENWNMSRACKFDHMFRGSGCTGTFRPNWNLSNIGNGDAFGLTHMFSYLNSTTDTIIDLSNCTVPKNHPVVEAASYVFSNSPHTTQVKFPKNLKLGNMNAMFRNCSGLTTVDISGLDLSECTVMSLVFQGNTSLTSLDLSNLDVRKVTTFESMFENCTNLQTITGIETWATTTASGANISKMFYNCSSLTSDIDMHGITAYVSSSNAIYTFANCTSIKNIIAPKFSSISMLPFGMFKNTPLLEKVTFTEFNDFLTSTNVNNCGNSEYAIGFFENKNLTTIEGDFNVNFTNNMTIKYYTDDYWRPFAFSWFKLCNKLTNVHFTGTIYSSSNFTKYGIFNSCDTSNLTNESWQSFVNIFPENTDGVTKYISVGTSTAYIPEVYASQLTAKGYTLVTTA